MNWSQPQQEAGDLGFVGSAATQPGPESQQPEARVLPWGIPRPGLETQVCDAALPWIHSCPST